jgi:hypothetical protein
LPKNPNFTTDTADLHGKKVQIGHFESVNPWHPCSSVVGFAFLGKAAAINR